MLNSCIIATFERHVFVFNRLTHMMEKHEKVGRDIKIKTIENYNSRERSAFIWVGEKDKVLLKLLDG